MEPSVLWENHSLPASDWWPAFQRDGDSLKFHLVVLQFFQGKGVGGTYLGRKHFQRKQTPSRDCVQVPSWKARKTVGTHRNRHRWIESHSCQAGNVQEPYKYLKLKRATLKGKECRADRQQTENKWSMEQSKNTSQGLQSQHTKPSSTTSQEASKCGGPWDGKWW